LVLVLLRVNILILLLVHEELLLHFRLHWAQQNQQISFSVLLLPFLLEPELFQDQFHSSDLKIA